MSKFLCEFIGDNGKTWPMSMLSTENVDSVIFFTNCSVPSFVFQLQKHNAYCDSKLHCRQIEMKLKKLRTWLFVAVNFLICFN